MILSKEGYFRYAFDDADFFDKAVALTLGENSTRAGRDFSNAGRKPMGKSQDATVRQMINAGLSPSDAAQSVLSSDDAKKQRSSATVAQKKGDEALYNESSAAAKDARDRVSVPADLPPWALHDREEPYMTTLIGLWKETGDSSSYLPKRFPDTLEGGGIES